MNESDSALMIRDPAVGQSLEASNARDAATAGGMLSAEERLQLATDAAEIGWWDVQDGYGQLTWSPRVKAMFGFSPDAFVTLDDFFAGLHPADRDRVVAAYADAVSWPVPEPYDVHYRTIGKEDGIIRWISATGRGVFDATGRCTRFIGIAIDITDRKRVEQETKRYHEHEAELREEFLAVLGHDLRAPLAAIEAATRIMVYCPEMAAELGEHVKQSVARMAALIENLLDSARGRLGGGFISARDCEQPLEPVLFQVIDEIRDVHPTRSISVDINLSEPVACDRLRIGQLLSNLLSNAIAYGAPDSPMEVHARATGGWFEFSVSNTGEPIEQAEIGRLFHPFFRGKVRSNRDGLGLGLYICCEIAKAHDGTLDVISEGRKTCFVLRMPTGK